ncbi:hypothetical protein ALQ36_101601 [Pseudomonas syringae pv. primulae]|uniref:Uncharacterized protein n=2 Tax=Pseudomonas syringae group genomosp. 3 TaxID=251701 RepID=A0A3M4S9J4_9PSED|nr:hypothetical protein ALO40_101126 [Pseudomonas syringae pv. viburni]RMO79378.1 hypothetical protein ALQ36_101601 [Pseudomonas syringae pv. primulae]RMR11538.1 hypothetical protein ALP92_101679 [Pseudomonas syringae pv. primulae]RMU38890.1 hypothetical protein ALP30_101742 [Pseudomonas syringae pv. primulae]
MFAHTGPCDLLPTARQAMHGMSGEPVRESTDGDGAFKIGRSASQVSQLPTSIVLNPLP